MPVEYLFAFQFGPVQSFIRQSRKLQDLFAGSLLLSHICESGLSLAKKYLDKNLTVIYPSEDSPYKPNRFLLRFSSLLSEADLVKKAQSLEKELREQFVEEMYSSISKDVPAPDGTKTQLSQHLEIYWAIEKNEKPYACSYKKVQRTLAAVRQARQFAQINYQQHEGVDFTYKDNPVFGESGRKCALDGQLNVKFYRLSNSENKKRSIDQAKAQQELLDRKLFVDDAQVTVLDYFHNEKGIENPTLRHVQPGEGLSAVGFGKRLFKNEAYTFPSTAEVCQFDLERRFPIAFENYKICLNALDLDTEDTHQLLYRHNLTDDYVRKNLPYTAWNKWSNGQGGLKHTIRAKQKELIKHIQGDKIQRGEPIPSYYACVTFDGDNMGKWWTGQWLPPGTDLAAFHVDLAKQLGLFGEEVQSTPKTPGDKKQKYRSVYCGEENLFFVNLEYLFPLLTYWRQAYEKIVSQPICERYGINDRRFSFSAGIVIAHYKYPLSMVVDQAKHLEHLAKESREEKDTFALGVYKRSGEILHSHWPWYKEDTPVSDSLDGVLQNLRNDSSNTFIKRLSMNFHDILDQEGKTTIPKLIIQSELERLFRRSSDKYIPKELPSAFLHLLDLCTDKTNAFIRLRNFLSVLETLDFISRVSNGTDTPKTTAHVVTA